MADSSSSWRNARQWFTKLWLQSNVCSHKESSLRRVHSSQTIYLLLPGPRFSRVHTKSGAVSCRFFFLLVSHSCLPTSPVPSAWWWHLHSFCPGQILRTQPSPSFITLLSTLLPERLCIFLKWKHHPAQLFVKIFQGLQAALRKHPKYLPMYLNSRLAITPVANN